MSDQSLNLLFGAVPEDFLTPDQQPIVEDRDEFLKGLEYQAGEYPPVPDESLAEPVRDDESNVTRLAELDEYTLSENVAEQVLAPAVELLNDGDRAWFEQFGETNDDRFSAISQRMVDVPGFADKVPAPLKDAVMRGGRIFQQAEQMREDYSWAQVIPAYILANPKTVLAEVAAETLALALILAPEPASTATGVAVRAGLESLRAAPTLARFSKAFAVEGAVAGGVAGVSSTIQNTSIADVKAQVVQDQAGQLVQPEHDTVGNVLLDMGVTAILGGAIGGAANEVVKRVAFSKDVSAYREALKHRIKNDPEFAQRVGYAIARRNENPEQFAKFQAETLNDMREIKISTAQGQKAMKRGKFKQVKGKDGVYELPADMSSDAKLKLIEAIDLDSVRNYRISGQTIEPGVGPTAKQIDNAPEGVDVEYNFDAFPLSNVAPQLKNAVEGQSQSIPPGIKPEDLPSEANWDRVVSAGRGKDGFYNGGNPWIDNLIDGEDPNEVITWDRSTAEAVRDSNLARKEFDNAPAEQKQQAAVSAVQATQKAQNAIVEQTQRVHKAVLEGERRTVANSGGLEYVQTIADRIHIVDGDNVVASITRTPGKREGEELFHLRNETNGGINREVDATAFNDATTLRDAIVTPKGKVAFKANNLSQALKEFMPRINAFRQGIDAPAPARAEPEVIDAPDIAPPKDGAKPADADLGFTVKELGDGDLTVYDGKVKIGYVTRVGDSTHVREVSGKEFTVKGKPDTARAKAMKKLSETRTIMRANARAAAKVAKDINIKCKI